MIVIVMGVAGSGKSTVGRLLAESTGFDCIDADTLHSPANIAKMRAAIPLTDSDRAPWLSAIRDLIALEEPVATIVVDAAQRPQTIEL